MDPDVEVLLKKIEELKREKREEEETRESRMTPKLLTHARTLCHKFITHDFLLVIGETEKGRKESGAVVSVEMQPRGLT